MLHEPSFFPYFELLLWTYHAICSRDPILASWILIISLCRCASGGISFFHLPPGRLGKSLTQFYYTAFPKPPGIDSPDGHQAVNASSAGLRRCWGKTSINLGSCEGISESPLLVFVDRAGCVASMIRSPKVCGLKLNRLPGKVISFDSIWSVMPFPGVRRESLSFGWHDAHWYCLELFCLFLVVVLCRQQHITIASEKTTNRSSNLAPFISHCFSAIFLPSS